MHSIGFREIADSLHVLQGRRRGTRGRLTVLYDPPQAGPLKADGLPRPFPPARLPFALIPDCMGSTGTTGER